MSERVVVAGVGMIPFRKPGQSEAFDDMGAAAAQLAIADAGIQYGDIQQAYAGYVFGDSTCGQSALYKVGLSAVPIVNVNNNCASGATALFLARQLVSLGGADCVLAVGFEQMARGAIGIAWPDRKTACEIHEQIMADVQGVDEKAPGAAQFFGGAGRDYAKLYGIKDETFAKISVKARRHAANNPYAVFRDPVTLEEVMAAPHLYGPLTRLQSCPPTCGAAAVVLCSERFAKRKGLDCRVVVRGQAMTTDPASSFETRDMVKLIGYDMAKLAADKAYAEADLGPADIKVVELHDCFTANELITYETLGLAKVGETEQFVEDGDNTYGGRCVVNPSGGLLSKGHPLGATGLAQCTELVWQLRGNAGPRQVEDARVGLAHNLGLGGACVVTILERAG